MVHSSDRLTRRSALLLLAAVGGSLAGCGFQPLYGKREGGETIVADLQQIRIAPLPDRTGQTMHNLLRDRINPYGQPTDPLYELHVTLSELVTEQGILKDETSSRSTLTMTANYQLVDLKQQQPVTNGISRATSAFNIVENRYSSVISEQTARDRAMAEVAEDMRLRLASYFSSLAKS